MSILTKSELKYRVTEDEKEYNKYKGDPNNWKILIKPRKEDNFENASYDISVGRIAIKLTDFIKEEPPVSQPYPENSDEEVEKIVENITKDPRTIDVLKEKVTVPPNEGVIIYSLEKIGLPLNITGIVNTKIGLALRGGLQLTTRINPGWSGHLMIPIYNFGSRTIDLEYEKPFSNVMFLLMDKLTEDSMKREVLPYTSLFQPMEKPMDELKKSLEKIKYRGPVIQTLSVMLLQMDKRLWDLQKTVEELENDLEEIWEEIRLLKDLPRIFGESFMEITRKWEREKKS